MCFLKRICVYFILILLVFSIYNDLTVGTLIEKQESIQVIPYSSKDSFSVVSIKIQSGDTLLSKVEQINSDLPVHLNIAQITDDFLDLNPGADPLQLKINTDYLFPRYKNN